MRLPAAIAARRVASTPAPGASLDEVLRLPFGPGTPAAASAGAQAEPVPAAATTFATASRRSSIERDDAALADPAAAELELRLDHREDAHRRRRSAPRTGPRIFVSEMKLTSTTASDGRERQRRGVELARVDPSKTVDPLVLAQRPVELAAADVERDRPRRPALEQAVGEAAGRGADVEAVAALGSTPSESSAASSFSPPRETKRRPPSISIRVVGGRPSGDGFAALSPPRPIRTWPARIELAAAVRDGARPRRSAGCRVVAAHAPLDVALGRSPGQ